MATAYESDDSDFESETDELTENFNQACKHVEYLTTSKGDSLSQNTLLDLYGFYKIATVGACREPKPSFYQFRAAKKWDAWHKLGAMSSEDGKKGYIETVKQLDPNWTPGDKGENESSTTKKPGWINVSSLAKAISDEDLTKTDDLTKAFDSVKKNDATSLSAILKQNQNIITIINQFDDSGLAMIHWACDRGNEAVLKTLLESGADVNLTTVEDGQTPLHFAVSCDHLECVKLLLGHNADKSIEDGDGLTPVDIADSEEILKMLG